MTKEQIIKRYEPYPNKAEVSIIGAMMDEWAVRFGIWVQGCNYAPATEDGKWQNQLIGENDIITTEELYQIFENQNK
jgi:hypothetical protein